MPKPRWPPIISYRNMKTSDEKYNNATKVVSLFTYTFCPDLQSSPELCFAYVSSNVIYWFQALRELYMYP